MNLQGHELTLLLGKKHKNINPGKEAKKSSGFARDVEICNTEGQGKKGVERFRVLFKKELSLN